MLFFGFLEASVILLQLIMFYFYRAGRNGNNFVQNLNEAKVTSTQQEIDNLSVQMISECHTAVSDYRTAILFRALSFVTIYCTDAYVVVKYWNLHLSLKKFAGVQLHKWVENSSAIIFYSLLVCTVVLETAFVFLYWQPFTTLKSDTNITGRLFFYLTTCFPILILTVCFGYSVWAIKSSSQVGKYTISTEWLVYPMVFQVLLLIANFLSCPNFWLGLFYGKGNSI